MELKVGDSYKCPEGHKATIAWISEDKKVIAARCRQEHLKKVVKVADHSKTALPYRHHPRKERFMLGTWFFSSKPDETML